MVLYMASTLRLQSEPYSATLNTLIFPRPYLCPSHLFTPLPRPPILHFSPSCLSHFLTPSASRSCHPSSSLYVSPSLSSLHQQSGAEVDSMEYRNQRIRPLIWFLCCLFAFCFFWSCTSLQRVPGARCRARSVVAISCFH